VKAGRERTTRGGGINRRLRLVLSASLIGRLGSSTFSKQSCVVYHGQIGRSCRMDQSCRLGDVASMSGYPD
jgi:hypothetical protein